MSDTNPGGLAKGLTPADLGKRNLSRNNLLFGLMQRMGLVEKVGSGIIRMKNAMQEWDLTEPIFDINDNWFTIIFNRSTKKWVVIIKNISPKKKDFSKLLSNINH